MPICCDKRPLDKCYPLPYNGSNATNASSSGSVLHTKETVDYVAFRSCRLQLLVSLMAVLWLSALTAHAGSYYWTNTDAQGKVTYSPVYSGGTFYGQGRYGPGTQNCGPVVSPTGLNSWGGTAGGVPSVNAGGTITATFTWKADPKLASDPPPAHILVTEISSAIATALWAPNPFPGTGTVSCNDGIGPNGAITTTTSPGPSTTTSSCQDVRETLKSNQQTVTVSCTPYATASGNISASQAGVFYVASISVDTRGVAISANVDITNMKAPVYSAGGAVKFDAYGNIVFHPVPHTPTSDGTMYGDIGIGYGVLGGPDALLHKSVNFTPHLAGTWGTASTYNWFSSLKQSGGGGPTFGNTYATATVNTVTTIPLIIPGDSGQIDHIHLTVKDSKDGASTSADYYLALHQPVEFYASKQATEHPTKEIEEVEVGAPGYASPGLTVNCTFNAPGAYWDYLSGGADAMAEIPGVDETLPWFGLFCSAAGIAVDHLKPVPDTGGASFDPVQPGSDFPDEALHPFATTPHSLFKMKPHILGLYIRTHLLQDTWNGTGFVSEAPIDSDVYLGSGGSYGTYRWLKTSNVTK